MILQIAIFTSSMLALAGLTAPHRKLRLAGSIIGFCGQPLWLYATYHAKQWGIFALSFVYAAMYLRGMWSNWKTSATTHNRLVE